MTSRSKMCKVVVCVALIILVQCYQSSAVEERLNIGVKKRVKDCKMKSQNGDTLHMHYTVFGVTQNLLNL